MSETEEQQLEPRNRHERRRLLTTGTRGITRPVALPSGEYVDEQTLMTSLGVSPRTLQRWRQTGEGPPYIRIGKKRAIYLKDDVKTWLHGNRFFHTAEENEAELATA